MRFALLVALALVVLLALVLIVARTRFDRASDDQIDVLLARVPAEPGVVVGAAELRRLPAPVARWLTAAGVVGRPRARTVRLRQEGELRTAPDKPWMPAAAEQYYSIDQPGFVWTTSVRMLRVVPLVGRDTYAGGHGRMLIVAAALVPVVDATGFKIDEGALLRFLGELIWFPSAALAEYVDWSPVDDRSALATMTYGGISASARFHFDAHDRVDLVEAERYFGGDPSSQRAPWVIPLTAWARFDGVTVPVAGEVTWALPDGVFSYYRWRITALEIDRRARWPD